MFFSSAFFIILFQLPDLSFEQRGQACFIMLFYQKSLIINNNASLPPTNQSKPKVDILFYISGIKQTMIKIL